jgi:hypothetical protein
MGVQWLGFYCPFLCSKSWSDGQKEITLHVLNKALARQCRKYISTVYFQKRWLFPSSIAAFFFREFLHSAPDFITENAFRQVRRNAF